MLIKEGREYYTVGEAAKMIGRTPLTIRIWYRAKEYAEENDIITEMPFLPIPIRDLDKMGSRYFTKDQVEMLRRFKEELPRGALSFYNREKSWGERGKIIQERENFKKEIKENLEKEN